jgi:hypothetical protein
MIAIPEIDTGEFALRDTGKEIVFVLSLRITLMEAMSGIGCAKKLNSVWVGFVQVTST